ncbi:Adenosylhomocysteinase [Fulvivirga imtechensis AK7]|uniref:Adenosylhomocysteinase n=1 Tax=Fulvivirga imtechensis AK7 TaxID=1237149 RepID=L8JXH0_9BACT|nr:NUDIX hydrolase [Fulvivirga imtechensis]ELR72319.1 Adenosylhomocysteinase [Fulvivirga imtechensis AK7]
MHRQKILEQLQSYSPELEAEKQFRASFLAFIEVNSTCFERSLQEGHITGSAWIINHERDKALLTHHFKLDRWLQLGGHADGDPDIIRVATKEATEESGLSSIELVSDQIFDIDIHTIPARKAEPEHLHYDVRFLFKADEQEPLVVNRESKELAWLYKNELWKLSNNNESILRMAEKSLK